jgi:hypothetical protein
MHRSGLIKLPVFQIKKEALQQASFFVCGKHGLMQIE